MIWTDDPAVLRWREDLVKAGFSDDGARLRGLVPWEHPEAGATTARVEIEPGESFPFTPPHVQVIDAGVPLELTFHVDRPRRGQERGNLCLWEDDWPVDQAPWLDARRLVNRIAGWLKQTASGWPGDDVCDLERYLEQSGWFLTYDAEVLPGLQKTLVRADRGPHSKTVIVTAVAKGTAPPRDRSKDPRGAGWVWIDDLSSVEEPIRSWSDVEARLGEGAVRVRRDALNGAIQWLLLTYTRGDESSVLALRVNRGGGEIQLQACEGADTSRGTRMMRAGTEAGVLGTAKIAIVGCGAIGSFTADALFRSGVRKLTLLDGEKLRPGNVVRHLTGSSHVGRFKVDAVLRALGDVDRDTAAVQLDRVHLVTLERAVALMRGHDVVLDATGSPRATSLLTEAAAETGCVVVSACVQRDGDVVRVDRFPARPAETYLPPLARREDASYRRERGCGSAVSLTPPGAVVAAAELACRVVIDEVKGSGSLPASLADVRRPQQEVPFDQLGLVQPHPTTDAGPP
jgi:hypothetical protein